MKSDSQSGIFGDRGVPENGTNLKKMREMLDEECEKLGLPFESGHSLEQFKNLALTPSDWMQ